MFGKLFGKKNKAPENSVYLTARLKARIQPLDRGHYFEDPLDEVLREKRFGEVTGGGTQMAAEPAGIEFCDVNLVIKECEALMDGEFRGHWQGSEKTSLYFYGPSFDAMKAAIEAFIDEYPLCHKAIVERIA